MLIRDIFPDSTKKSTMDDVLQRTKATKIIKTKMTVRINYNGLCSTF